jgi:primosomal protein N' (replication factor Y)
MKLFDDLNEGAPVLAPELFNSSDQIISVAVPRPLPGLFTYRLPSHLAPLVKLGGWVKVPFGRSITHAFIVESPKDISEISAGIKSDALKEVLEVSDPEQSLPDDVMALCRWAHEYYCVPLGEVLNCAASLGSMKKQLKPRRTKIKKRIENFSPHILTSDQMFAVGELEKLLLRGKETALLHGVTGSGKTEVYIELTKRALSLGKNVIVLVPEIALTPQLHQRFEENLNIEVGLWHSAVAMGQRQRQFTALKKGELRVVVGARSAVFAPLPRLGLIIVDEEHDPTYKQLDRVWYNARDLAVVRGKLTQSLVILGSATPSFETRERVFEGKYSKATLKSRIACSGLPQIEMVDLKEEPKLENIQAPMAVKTVKAIQDVIDAGEQVIIYLNRRGFASFLLCKDCGEVTHCQTCSISLTVHKKSLEMRCHVCGHREEIPDFCKKCKSTNLHAMGAGTESLEIEIPQIISGAKVLRLDRDQVTSATRLEQILNEFRRGDANVLLGTQMLVKGHDFPGVTLVVVVLADSLFRWPDFRAPERAFQVLKQVAGRAGRGEKPGRVLIQTFDPHHMVLQVIEGKVSEESFIESERQLRQALSYPPFGRLARLRFESNSRQTVIERSKKVTEYLNSTFVSDPTLSSMSQRNLELLGPSEAFLERAKGIYRWDLLLKARDIGALQKAIHCSQELCVRNKWPLIVDVDPCGV